MKYLAPLSAALFVAITPFAAAADTLRDGNYTLVIDGGQGIMEIASGYARLAIGGQGCSGSAEGEVSAVVDRMASFTAHQGGRSCTVRIAVGEDGLPRHTEEGGPECYTFHGASCGFSGVITGSETPAAIAPAGPDFPVSMRAITDAFNELPRETRMRVQEVLREHGHYHGAIDGMIGPGTRQAIIDQARSELAATPGLVINLGNRATARARLILLTHLLPPQPAPAPQPASKPAPASGSGADTEARTDVTVTATSTLRDGPAWTGDWHCATDMFDRPAHFTFTEGSGTIHNLGRTVSHGGAQPIGGRENALLIEFADGEQFGLFDVQPDSMVIAANAGILDCTR